MRKHLSSDTAEKAPQSSRAEVKPKRGPADDTGVDLDLRRGRRGVHERTGKKGSEAGSVAIQGKINATRQSIGFKPRKSRVRIERRDNECNFLACMQELPRAWA